MFYSGEVTKTLADFLIFNACNIRCDACGEGVVDIMLASEAKTLLFHIERLRLLNFVLSLFNITNDSFLFQLCKRVLNGFNIIFLQFTFDDWIIGPIDKGILWCLVLDNAHFSIYIVLHLKVISVKMIRCNIQQNRNVGSEVIHIVQLERTELNDIVGMWIFCNLEGK